MRASDVSIEEIVATARRMKRDQIPDYCGIKNCARPYRAINLCFAHYMRFWEWRQTNDWTLPPYEYEQVTANEFKGSTRLTVKELTCRVANCKRKYHARGLCQSHYLKWWKQVKREEAK